MLKLPVNLGDSPSILCIGAHCDDIEIGCGGTLIALLNANPDLTVTWAICSGSAERRAESAAAARSIGGDRINLQFLDFRDGHLPWSGASVKDDLRSITAGMDPDIIFTHFGQDLHQDHRLLNELTWNLFRNHLILEYEIPKYDGDLGRPTVFVPLEVAAVDEKIRILLESFPTQAGKHWFTDETFRSLLRIRGIESGRRNRYAEAFYCRKFCLDPG